MRWAATSWPAVECNPAAIKPRPAKQTPPDHPRPLSWGPTDHHIGDPRAPRARPRRADSSPTCQCRRRDRRRQGIERPYSAGLSAPGTPVVDAIRFRVAPDRITHDPDRRRSFDNAMAGDNDSPNAVDHVVGVARPARCRGSHGRVSVPNRARRSASAYPWIRPRSTTIIADARVVHAWLGDERAHPDVATTVRRVTRSTRLELQPGAHRGDHQPGWPQT
jgi:hypothetical protein